jgi:chromosome segregation ATPase
VSGVISDASSRVVRDDQSEISMLQEVIDDMTTEKLGLMRGLQKSQAMVDKLANENDALMQRYNETKSQLSHTRDELDRLWLQYQERSAMGGDNDGLMMGNPDTSERVQSLAAEVVALEERLQDMARIEDENDRLRAEAKRSNSHASELELVLEATREQDRLFKERIRESNFMKTLCAWLKKKDADVEREAREKASSMEKQREQAELSANTTETDDEQIELLSSIHELLEQLEIEKKTLSRQLNSANEAKQQLSERNTLLESQLAKVLNRLADGGDGWSSEEEEKPRRGGLFSFLRRRQE